MTLAELSDLAHAFAFAWPFVMSYVWMGGALLYWLFRERGKPGPEEPPALDDYPKAAVIVPCHNEELNIIETLEQLDRLSYPNYEIIAVNDGSTDRTAELIDRMALERPRIRAVHLEQNQGKAAAMRTATLMTEAEYLVCIDADALLHRHAVTWLVRSLMLHPRIGGVTGNPRIRNRSTVLARLQTGEFSSIIGLIKRAQSVYGRIFTVSGVVCAFRKRALADVGYWGTGMLTDDVDVSWRLQLNNWRIRFEPRALCWTLMPGTLRGLWRQRLRWAAGGAQIAISHFPDLLRPRGLRMLPVFVEYGLGVIWSYTMLVLCILWLVSWLPGLEPTEARRALFGDWGFALGMTFLIQATVAVGLERRTEPGIERTLYWIVWYPLVFWGLNAATVVVGLPKGIRALGRSHARWASPDRGVHQLEDGR
jgi:biofilm PGA synthesis N-glycosyltransferase PgaC